MDLMCGLWWIRNWLDSCIQKGLVKSWMEISEKWRPQGRYWDKDCLNQWHSGKPVHPQQICRWHQPECHSWHGQGMKCHPEGPGKAESGLMGTLWGSTRPNVRSCSWARATPCINTGMRGLRAALKGRTWTAGGDEPARCTHSPKTQP